MRPKAVIAGLIVQRKSDLITCPSEGSPKPYGVTRDVRGQQVLGSKHTVLTAPLEQPL